MKHRTSVWLSLTLAIAFIAPATHASPPQDKEAAKSADINATGTFEPEEVVEIQVQVSGMIQALNVDHGTLVKKGEVLAQVDPTLYAARLTQAKADMHKAEAALRLGQSKAAVAERDYQRLRQLSAQNSVSQSELEMARAKVDIAQAEIHLEQAGVAQAKAAVQRAEIDLGYCMIHAPVDGIILDRRCTVGQTVTNNANSTPLFLIARDLQNLRLMVRIHEKEIGRVAVGQKVLCKAVAFPEDTFQGRVTQIRLHAKRENERAYYTVVVSIENRAKRLLPYMTAAVNIEVDGR